MVLLTPFSKSLECRNFIFDLITAFKPTVIFTDDAGILENPGNIHSRYLNALKGVEVVKLPMERAISGNDDPTKRTLYLSNYDKLLRLVTNRPDLASKVKRTILYPSGYDIRIDTRPLQAILGDANRIRP